MQRGPRSCGFGPFGGRAAPVEPPIPHDAGHSTACRHYMYGEVLVPGRQHQLDPRPGRQAETPGAVPGRRLGGCRRASQATDATWLGAGCGFGYNSQWPAGAQPTLADPLGE
jgi:hypothetical protein